MYSTWFGLFLVCVSGLGACKKKSAPKPVASAAGNLSRPNSAASKSTKKPHRWRVPSGPRVAIVAGKGLGPIRLGAKVSTVERQMQLPCDFKTKKICRYVNRAAEFELNEEGRVARIRAHRYERSTGNPKNPDETYGIFNGGLPPDVLFGMIPSEVKKVLGTPKSITKGNNGAHPSAVEQHTYEGIVIEFDRAKNGKLIFGGVRIPN